LITISGIPVIDSVFGTAAIFLFCRTLFLSGRSLETVPGEG
jgi:hypothetical protein